MLDIIIPCFNEAKYLKNLLQSIQINIKDYNKIHLYIIDDCSLYGEDYKQLVHQFSSIFDISYYKTEKNSGPGIARNIGLFNSNHNLITFIDDDDEIVSDILNFCEEKHDIIISAYNQSDGQIKVCNYPIDSVQGLIFSRKFLDLYNLKFDFNLFQGTEDAVFRVIAMGLTNDIKLIPDQFYLRNYRINSNFYSRPSFYGTLSIDEYDYLKVKRKVIFLANVFSAISNLNIDYQNLNLEFFLNQQCRFLLKHLQLFKKLKLYQSETLKDWFILILYGALKYNKIYNNQYSFIQEVRDYANKFFILNKYDILIQKQSNDNINSYISNYLNNLSFLISSMPYCSCYYDINSIIKIYSKYYYNTQFENDAKRRDKMKPFDF